MFPNIAAWYCWIIIIMAVYFRFYYFDIISVSDVFFTKFAIYDWSEKIYHSFWRAYLGSTVRVHLDKQMNWIKSQLHLW